MYPERMFITRKDLESIEGKLDKLSDSIKSVEEKISRIQKISSRLDEQDKRVDEIHRILSSSKDRDDTIGTQFIDELARFSDNNTQLRKRIDSFKVLEDKAAKKLLEETQAEINSQIQGLFATTREYRKLEEGLRLANSNINNLQNEISKLLQISSNIRASDFIMANYARKVTEEDREKLRLMRENDNLKRIISKERRIR